MLGCQVHHSRGLLILVLPLMLNECAEDLVQSLVAATEHQHVRHSDSRSPGMSALGSTDQYSPSIRRNLRIEQKTGHFVLALIPMYDAGIAHLANASTSILAVSG